MTAFDIIRSFGARVGGYVSFSASPKVTSRNWDIPEHAEVVPFSVPYFCAGETNLAAFAASRDYHLYARVIDGALKEYFAARYPDRFCSVFADVSPFHETRLCAFCGLGVIGDHGMLIDPEYSSFVVLGEAVMELGEDELSREGFVPADGEIRTCEHCGMCRSACPVGGIEDKSRCLSALSQKKGELSASELETLRENRAVWGCDRCIRACPHTSEPPKESPEEFFHEDRLGIVTDGDILRMTEEEYRRYSFSWRKRDVIIRNLRICGFCENTTDGSEK